jgi:hypothetical protein
VGTSSSSKGPGSKSPLVPPWADAEPDAPLPAPEGQRFRGFRTAFGDFVGTGSRESLGSSLGKYASSATGGSGVGPRRFGPAYSAGGGLFQLLGEMQAGGTGAESVGTDLSALVGQSIDQAAQEIARAFTPANADADKIAAAIQEAISEALPNVDIFVLTTITDDQIILIMVEFLARILFQQVTEDAGNAWNKTMSGERTVRAEAELFDLVRTAIDKHLSPRLSHGIGQLNRDAVASLQKSAMEDVWREWEAYDR